MVSICFYISVTTCFVGRLMGPSEPEERGGQKRPSMRSRRFDEAFHTPCTQRPAVSGEARCVRTFRKDVQMLLRPSKPCSHLFTRPCAWIYNQNNQIISLTNHLLNHDDITASRYVSCICSEAVRVLSPSFVKAA